MAASVDALSESVDALADQLDAVQLPDGAAPCRDLTKRVDASRSASRRRVASTRHTAASSNHVASPRRAAASSNRVASTPSHRRTASRRRIPSRRRVAPSRQRRAIEVAQRVAQSPRDARVRADLGELDDAAEFADAFVKRAIGKRKLVEKKWPESMVKALDAAAPPHPTRAVCDLRILAQRGVLELDRSAGADGTLRARLLLAREIAMPRGPSKLMDDPRRIARFHLGFRACQWAASPHCAWREGPDLASICGEIGALRNVSARLRERDLVPQIETLAGGVSVSSWVDTQLKRTLAVQPPDVTDCDDYKQRLSSMGYPPHAVVVAYDKRTRTTETLLHVPLDAAASFVDVFMDVFHEAPGAADYLKAAVDDWTYAVGSVGWAG